MRQQKFLLFYLPLMIVSLVVFIRLYPEVHPMAGVYLPFNKVEIEDKAYKITKEVALNTEGFYADAVLTRNTELIRQAQMELGLANANREFRSNIPGYYWEVKWLEKDIFANLLFQQNKDTKSDHLAVLKNTRLHFDTDGSLIYYKRDVADTTRLPSLSRPEALSFAKTFLKQYTQYSALLDSRREMKAANDSITASARDHSEISEFLPHEKIHDSGRMDFEFTASQAAPVLNNEIKISVDVAGNIISGFEAKYDIPEKYRSSETPLNQFVFPILLMAILITTVVIALKRWRAYEMDFRFGIVLGIVGGLFFGAYIYYAFYRDTGAQILFPMVLNSLFTGGSLVFIWGVAESLGRETWKEKFIPIDLLRNRYFLNSRIGKNIIRGIAYGVMGLAVGSVLIKIVNTFQPLANIPQYNAGRSMFSSSAPLLKMFSQMGFVPIWTIAAYIVLAFTLLRRFFASSVLAIVLISAIVTLAHREGLEPFLTGFMIEAITFAIPLWVFYRYNILACFITILTYPVLSYGTALFFTGNSAFTISGYGLAACFIIVLGYALITLITRDRITDFARLAPSYYKNITERERLQKELEIAREVQMSFLPNSNPEFNTLDIASRCLPALEVGGDYYDFVHLGSNRLGIVIGDVSGKGTQAAFYMTLTKGFLRALANMSDSPAFVLTQLNRLFYDNVKRGVFISMIYGIFDMDEGMLSLARAGHNPVVMRKPREHELQMINPRGLALGMEKGEAFERLIQEVKIPIQNNDLFVFYTDGFTEAMNTDKEEFGEERFEQSIEKYAAAGAEDIMAGIFKDVQQFTGKAEQHDDMTIVVVKIAEMREKVSAGAIAQQLQGVKD